jgi:NADP-reducing hydrogenase subunit HndB
VARISIEDLAKIKERQRSRMVLREGEFRAKITVHMGTCGIAAGARDVMASLREMISSHNMNDIILTNSGCAGLCAKEPMITVELADQAPVKYVNLDRRKVRKVFDDHVMHGTPVENYALAWGSESTA